MVQPRNIPRHRRVSWQTVSVGAKTIVVRHLLAGIQVYPFRLAWSVARSIFSGSFEHYIRSRVREILARGMRTPHSVGSSSWVSSKQVDGLGERESHPRSRGGGMGTCDHDPRLPVGQQHDGRN